MRTGSIKGLFREARGFCADIHRKRKTFGCDRQGSAAVEFALVAMPLIFLIFAVFEIGVIFVLNFNLSNATASLGRQLRIGEIVAPGVAATTSNGTQLDLSDFKAAICNKIGLVPNTTCMSQLQVDVRTFNSFQNQSAPSPVSGATFSTNTFCFYSGASSSLVELRAFYLWPVITPVLLSALVNVKAAVTSSGSATGNWFMATSTEIFKVEPNGSITNTGANC